MRQIQAVTLCDVTKHHPHIHVFIQSLTAAQTEPEAALDGGDFIISLLSVSACEKVDAGLRLYRAAMAGDLVAMAAALAQGAEVNGSISEEEGRTALIGAAVGVRKSFQNKCNDGGIMTQRDLELLILIHNVNDTHVTCSCVPLEREN